VTLQSRRDADAERLMDPGEPLLGAVVATHRWVLRSRVCGADRLRTQLCAVEPAIERELAGGLRWKRIGDDGTTNG
jgi:hypothetical protein